MFLEAPLDKTKSGNSAYTVDSTEWQEYTFVIRDGSTGMRVLHRNGGEWEDIGISGKAIPSTDDKLQFSIATGNTGTMYIEDVAYSFDDYLETEINEEVVYNEKEVWYDIGGFVFEETVSVEDDIMQFEINTHFDMASSTATVTLNNSSGIYSPSFNKNNVFPIVDRIDTPFTYYDGGKIRHHADC